MSSMSTTNSCHVSCIFIILFLSYLPSLLQDHPHTTRTSTGRVRSIVHYSSKQAFLLSPLCQGKPPPPPHLSSLPCTHTLHAFSLKCDCDVVVQMVERANWSIRDTALFLDLVLEAKNLCHWSQRVPTSSGWTHILTKFNEVSDQKLSRRQLSNKWQELRIAYFKWRNAVLKKSSLGRDPQTRDVTYDPVLVAALSHEVLHSTFVIVLLQ
jgi:hypothetical protein